MILDYIASSLTRIIRNKHLSKDNSAHAIHMRMRRRERKYNIKNHLKE